MSIGNSSVTISVQKLPSNEQQDIIKGLIGLTDLAGVTNADTNLNGGRITVSWNNTTDNLQDALQAEQFVEDAFKGKDVEVTWNNSQHPDRQSNFRSN